MTETATPPATTLAVLQEIVPMTPRCPWCSALLPADTSVRCPHCHASLIAEADTRLPGLTEVEAPAANKSRRVAAQRRSKLLAWISGEIDDDPSPVGGQSAADAIAPPDRDVRREMLRLRLEAEGLTVDADGSIRLKAAPATEAPGADPGSGAQAAADEDVSTGARPAS